MNKKADEGLDYLDKKKKKRVGWWLLFWFIMPFTAFLKLEELLSDDEDLECAPEDSEKSQTKIQKK